MFDDSDEDTAPGDMPESFNPTHCVEFSYYVKKTIVKSNRKIWLDIHKQLMYFSTNRQLPVRCILNTSKTTTIGCVQISIRIGAKLKEKKWFFKDADEAAKFQLYIASINRCGATLSDIYNAITHDERVTWKELRKSGLKFGIRFSHQEAQALIFLADKDGNGSIDFTEFFNFFVNDHIISVEGCLLEWRNKLADDLKKQNSRSSMFVFEDGFTLPAVNTNNAIPSMCSGEITLNIVQHSRFTLGVPQANRVSSSFVGNIYLTNFRLIFSSYLQAKASFFCRYEIPPSFDEISLPIACIHHVEQLKKEEAGYALAIHCKDLRIMYVSFNAADSFAGLFKGVLESQAFVPKVTNLFAFNNKEIYLMNQGWGIYNVTKEFTRQGVLPSPHWRLWNDQCTLVDTYPREFVLPAALSMTDIVEAAKYRSKQRLPSLTWRSKENGACLARSSQPMVGVLGHRCLADKFLLNLYRVRGDTMDQHEIENPSEFYIVDCRKPIAATANSALGKGVEDAKNYENTKVVFINIENIHVMRASFKSLQDALCDNTDDMKFNSKVEESNWLSHIRHIIIGSISVAEKLHLERASVLVHCSDGWDRTAQVCATAQLLLDPYYRTLEGFCVLIEKEWCSFGHKMHDRLGHTDSNVDSAERSPVLLQWLDVVHQIQKQYVDQFEFNESLLIFVADALYSCLYGTFLGNSEKERKMEYECEIKTKSAWSFVLSNREHYVNNEYQQYQSAIWPSTSIRKLYLWERYFLRWESDLHPRAASGKTWKENYGIVSNPECSKRDSVNFRASTVPIHQAINSNDVDGMDTTGDITFSRPISVINNHQSNPLHDKGGSGNSTGASLASMIFRQTSEVEIRKEKGEIDLRYDNL